MKERYIQLLIAVSTLAIIGLVAIQVYWVNNTFMLREQDFTSNVSKALTEVADRLEEHELLVTAEQNASSPSVSIRAGGDSSVIVNYGMRGVDIVDPQRNDSALNDQSQILSQSGILDDIMDGMIELDIYKGITERIDTTYLDSLLKEALVIRGINATYVYGVFSRVQTPEILPGCGKNYTSQLITEGYKTQLFVHDPFSDTNYLRIYFPHQGRYLLGSMWKMLLIAASLVLVILFLFSYSIKTIYRQKKLSDIKNDFINNMTHELKTPIATISLACEALNDPDMRSSEAVMTNYVAMIRDENKRLGVLVENVLRTSIFESGEMKLRVDQIHIHEVIERVISNIFIQVKKKKGTIKTHLDASRYQIEGDQLHITNVIYNLIDNAIKYCESEPLIEIFTRDEVDGIAIEVRDNGIGITKENQQKIFDKLYRVPTGNVHNVKGFGLGLSYVKGVVEKHGGTVEVNSEIRKGSTFIIHLPYKNEKDN